MLGVQYYGLITINRVGQKTAKVMDQSRNQANAKTHNANAAVVRPRIRTLRLRSLILSFSTSYSLFESFDK